MSHEAALETLKSVLKDAQTLLDRNAQLVSKTYEKTESLELAGKVNRDLRKDLNAALERNAEMRETVRTLEGQLATAREALKGSPTDPVRLNPEETKLAEHSRETEFLITHTDLGALLMMERHQSMLSEPEPLWYLPDDAPTEETVLERKYVLTGAQLRSRLTAARLEGAAGEYDRIKELLG